MLFDTEIRRQVNMTPPDLDPDEVIALDYVQIWVRFDEHGNPIELRKVETLDAEDALAEEWRNDRYNFYSVCSQDENVPVEPETPTAAQAW